MAPAMIASLARSLQKCSGSSSSRSFRSRAMARAAKGPRVYKPARASRRRRSKSSGGPDPPAVLFREVGHVLPLPPGRPVEAPEAADDPDLGSVRGKPRVVILEESDLVSVGEAGQIRWMIVRILVVPEDGRDGGRDPVPDRPEDGVVGLQVVAVRRVPREEEQVDGPEAV